MEKKLSPGVAEFINELRNYCREDEKKMLDALVGWSTVYEVMKRLPRAGTVTVLKALSHLVLEAAPDDEAYETLRLILPTNFKGVR